MGLLKYWTLQQLPNFLLAGPLLAMSFAASISYYMHTWPGCLSRSIPFYGAMRQNCQQRKNKGDLHPFFNIKTLPFIHLHTILTLILILASHVQIALRQACTNPVIFWYAAILVQDGDRKAKWWIGYCIVWGAISIVLWTSFYPPA